MTLLEGKTALVTGAAQGFGWGIARALGRSGARVCATDVDERELAIAGEILKSDGSEAYTRPLDAGDAGAFSAVVGEVVGRWGRLDAVVHAGVIMPLERFEVTTMESWWRQLRISLGGIMNGARASWEVMKGQGGGHVIGIASGSSFRGYIDEVVYCAGKHGQEGFVKALALEAAPFNISLNTVGPGKRIKPTGMNREAASRVPEEVRSLWVDPAELGKAFVWLVAQPPGRYSGLRFDAGPIIDAIALEGWDFPFSPEKVTDYPDDLRARLQWQADYDKEASP